MSNQIDTVDEDMKNLSHTQAMCRQLMDTPIHKKHGPLGVFAIIQKAKCMGVRPLDALNGGMYCVNGKVELQAEMMNQLIRQNKHSIRKDPKSDDTICILHGKRADNGDEWTASFSIEEAKRARIYKGVWLLYPGDMLFARALSRLARQLFPDVIKGCYIEGELPRDDVSYYEPGIPETSQIEERISEEKWLEIDNFLNGHQELRDQLKLFCKVSDLRNIKESQIAAVKTYAANYLNSRKNLTNQDSQTN